MPIARSLLKGSAATALVAWSMNVFAGGAVPDIGGVWSRAPAEASQPAVIPPLKPRYLKPYAASRKPSSQPGTATTAALEKCKVEGLPTIMAAQGPLEILQTPGQVTVLAEYMSQTRRIFMDEALPPLSEVNPGYMGYSVGKWNGKVLEVHTHGIREDVRYLDIPHSAKMKITEQIQLTGPDQLRDDMTIVDPATLTQPYHLTFNYHRDRQQRMREYACQHAGAGPDSQK